jgi:hypothetical protein
MCRKEGTKEGGKGRKEGSNLDDLMGFGDGAMHPHVQALDSLRLQQKHGMLYTLLSSVGRTAEKEHTTSMLRDKTPQRRKAPNDTLHF